MPKSTETKAERSVSVFALMSQIDSQMWEENLDGWLIDLFIDNDTLYAIVGDDGRLYRASVTVMEGQAALQEQSMWELVQVNHVPVSFTYEDDDDEPSFSEEFDVPMIGQSSFSITQMADGTYRWAALAATAILNRSGQLDTRDLFDSFIADIEKTKTYPTLRFFHLMSEEFVLGTTDFVARDGFCYIASGIMDPSYPYTQALADDVAKDPGYWGTSIGFFLDGEPTMLDFGGVTIPTFHSGRNHEISVLPEKDAACLRTSFAIAQTRETNLMDPRIAEALKRLKIDPTELEDTVDQANMLAADPTVISRSADPEPQPESTEAPVEQAAPPATLIATPDDEPDEDPDDDDALPPVVIEVDEAFTQAVTDLVTLQMSPFTTEFTSAVLQAVDALAELKEAFALLAEEVDELKEAKIADDRAELIAQAAELSPAIAMRLSVNHRPRHANAENPANAVVARSQMTDTADHVLKRLPKY